ncbi:MAG: hypothetical protein NZ553_02655 [Caldilinea sp.]|nr:hypothetical protein [Caldilinea sp.]MDW8439351.1 hypothetical protein [Caldilineaceae bacterium]
MPSRPSFASIAAALIISLANAFQTSQAQNAPQAVTGPAFTLSGPA